MKVVKRDGRHEVFNVNKIIKAISAAYKAEKVKMPKETKEAIKELFNDGDLIGIEEIQDKVESILMKDNYNVAKAFVLYRYKHNQIRDFVTEKIKFIQKYKQSDNTANATIDDNSNVTARNIGILNAEIHKEDNIKISRGMVMRKLKELYPDFNAKNYVKDLESHIIYKHDESSFAGAISPYCCSITMYPFLTDGIKKLGGLSAKPKNLDSFCGMYVNLIFAVASQFAGAVATSEFFIYFDYFCKKEWGDDYYKFPNRKIKVWSGSNHYTILDEIHQKWQQVIYSINQPAASRGMQSASI